MDYDSLGGSHTALDKHGLMDFELGNEKKSACLHCAKLIEMFTIRHKTITFPGIDVKNRLDAMKATKSREWETKELDYMIKLYITGKKRQ